MKVFLHARTRRPRRLGLEHLEDRTIPAIDLTAAGLPISAAYATMAANVNTAAATLNVPPSEMNEGGTEQSGGSTGSSAASSTLVTASSVGAVVIPQVLVLEKALVSPLASFPTASFATQQSLDINGLGGQLATLLNASAVGTPDGTVPKSSLPLLYTAISGAIASSYQSTSSNLYLAATTPMRGALSSTALPVFPAVTTTGTATAATVGAQVLTQIAALQQSLAVSLSDLPSASSIVQAQLGVGGLTSEMASLFVAAGSQTTDSSVSQGMLPLLYSAVNSAMSASLSHAASAIFIDYAGQTAARPNRTIDVAAIAAQAQQAFATFAGNVLQAESTLYNPALGGPVIPGGPGIGTPTTTPSIALVGFTTMASTTATATGNFVVNLSNTSTTPVTVAYTTTDGTAVAGTDYTATSGTLTFAAGVTSLDVPVTILASAVTSGNKSFMLTLSNPTNATLSTTAGTGVITYGTGTGTTTDTVTLTPKGEEGPFFQDFTDATLDRSDITTGTTLTSVASAVPLTLTFNVYSVSGTTVTPLTGARVDVWNADAGGVYSDEDSEGTTGLTYLRGYQSTDSSGAVTFKTIVPGWYSGRTPHVHVMIRTGTTTLTNVLTTQLFFDQTLIDTVDTTASAYSSRGVPDTSNATDRVYNTTTTSGVTAGSLLQLTLTGSVTAGYTGTYNIYVAAS